MFDSMLERFIGVIFVCGGLAWTVLMVVAAIMGVKFAFFGG